MDPFDGEGQFIDKGFSYTLAIYYQNEEEKEKAEKKIAELEAESGQMAQISLEPFKAFYEAEEEHHQGERRGRRRFRLRAGDMQAARR